MWGTEFKDQPESTRAKNNPRTPDKTNPPTFILAHGPFGINMSTLPLARGRQRRTTHRTRSLWRTCEALPGRTAFLLSHQHTDGTSQGHRDNSDTGSETCLLRAFSSLLQQKIRILTEASRLTSHHSSTLPTLLRSGHLSLSGVPSARMLPSGTWTGT